MDLKQRLLKANRKLHVAQTKYDHDIDGIRKQMDQAGDSLVDERDALSDSLSRVYEVASQYKKFHTESQDKLCRSFERVMDLQVAFRREKANVADRSSDRARPRRVLLDRDSVLTQLRFELSNLTAERDRTVHDHRMLRDRISSLVTSDSLLIPTLVKSIDLLYGAAPTRPDPALTSRKRMRDTVFTRAQPVFKRATRSLISTPPPIQTGR